MSSAAVAVPVVIETMFSTSDDLAARDERTISSSWRKKAAPSELPIIVTGKNAVRVWRSLGDPGTAAAKGRSRRRRSKETREPRELYVGWVRRDKDPRWGVGQETRLRGSSANPKGGPQCRATNRSSNPLGVFACVCVGGLVIETFSTDGDGWESGWGRESLAGGLGGRMISLSVVGWMNGGEKRKGVVRGREQHK